MTEGISQLYAHVKDRVFVFNLIENAIFLATVADILQLNVGPFHLVVSWTYLH